jgi:hypothetical protein
MAGIGEEAGFLAGCVEASEEKILGRAFLAILVC